MKRITKCLQCSTAFRVHESQLTARQGKVRCGACGHVFDAFESLLESMPDERPSSPPPAAHAAVTNTPPAAPPAMADTSSCPSFDRRGYGLAHDSQHRASQTECSNEACSTGRNTIGPSEVGGADRTDKRVSARERRR